MAFLAPLSRLHSLSFKGVKRDRAQGSLTINTYPVVASTPRFARPEHLVQLPRLQHLELVSQNLHHTPSLLPLTKEPLALVHSYLASVVFLIVLSAVHVVREVVVEGPRARSLGGVAVHGIEVVVGGGQTYHKLPPTQAIITRCLAQSLVSKG